MKKPRQSRYLSVVAIVAVLSAGFPTVSSALSPYDRVFIVDPVTNTNAFERWWTANGGCYLFPGLCN